VNVPLARPAPDIGRFLDLLAGRAGGRPRLVEYLIDDAVMKPILAGLLDRTWVDLGPDRVSQAARLDNLIQFWFRLGYDAVRFEAALPFPFFRSSAADASSSTGRRDWADEHSGAIRTWQDFESYRWPRLEEMDFFPFEYIGRNLPSGMGLIASHAGGVFEHLSWIMSYEGLCLALVDEPELVRAVAGRIGTLQEAFYRNLLEIPGLAAVFPGDDMGFRSGTLLAPRDLRALALPWHKRFADMAHRRGLPYFLHSCGNVSGIMADLIEEVGIDGKHSFEDAIIPVEDFQERYGSRLAVLGGVDVHVLAEGSEEDVRRRVRLLMETCGSRGRFAVGSGNSIPSYVPVRNYLAMIDEAAAG
jgi:uroporphyrinogen decarboxylase